MHIPEPAPPSTMKKRSRIYVSSPWKTAAEGPPANNATSDRKSNHHAQHQQNKVFVPGRSSYFLDNCRHCRKVLDQGTDIYMYRGDKAFCSVECRDKAIAVDMEKIRDLKESP